MKNVCKFGSAIHRKIDMLFEMSPNTIIPSFMNQAVN